MLAQSEIESKGLIRMEDGSAPPQENFDKTSYNLRLGAEYCLVRDGDESADIRDLARESGVLLIPPFACVLVSTEEFICTPKDIFGRWGLKIRPAMSGLVFQAGPQIEPGSYTRLYGLLFNLSNKRQQLHLGSTLWSIDFETVSGDSSSITEPAQPTRKGMREYLKYGVPQGSLNEIYEDYRKLQKDSSDRREIRIYVVLGLVTLALTTVIPVMSTLIPFLVGQTAPASQVEELQREVLELTSDLARLEQQVESDQQTVSPTETPTP